MTMTKLSDGTDCLTPRPVVCTGAGDSKHQRSPVVHSRCYSCQRKVVTTRGDYTQCQVCGMKEGDSDVKEIRTLTFCEICLHNESIRQALFSSLCEIPTAVNTCYFDSYTDGVLKIYACQRQDGCWNKIRRSKALAVLRTPPEKRAPSKKKPKLSDAEDSIMGDEETPVSPKTVSPKKPKMKRTPKAAKAGKANIVTANVVVVAPGMKVDIPSPSYTPIKQMVEGDSPIPSYSYESEGTMYTPYSTSPTHNNENGLDNLGMWSPAEPVGPPMEELFNIWNEPAALDSVGLVPSSGDQVDDHGCLEPLESPWM